MFILSQAKYDGDARGSFTCSQRWLAEKVGMSYKALRIFLDRLYKEEMIHISTERIRGARSGATRGATKGATISRITICNYNKYQSVEAEEGAAKGTRSGATRGTILKKDKNIKKVSPSLRSGDARAREGENGVLDLGEPEKTKKVARQGTWIDRAWLPSSDTIDGLQVTCPDVDIGATLEIFIDYWDGRDDARAKKCNWDATFRNWCRKEQADGKKSNGGFPPRESPSSRARREQEEQMDEGRRAIDMLKRADQHRAEQGSDGKLH
jgi:hypothetical protein